MTTLPRCRHCGQPLAITEDAETYCPDCLGFRPTWPSFDAWMEEVDRVLVRKVGVCSADLPDWTYRDAFDQGATPEEAADEVIENSMS